MLAQSPSSKESLIKGVKPYPTTDNISYMDDEAPTEALGQAKKKYVTLSKLFPQAAPIAASLILMYPANWATDNTEPPFSTIKTPNDTADFTQSNEKSLAKELSSISEKYEQVLYSFPGVVIKIEKNDFGENSHALISVSLEGNDYIVKRYIHNIGFDVLPQMRLIVDCVERGGKKKLSFRKAEPVELDEEEMSLLKGI